MANADRRSKTAGEGLEPAASDARATGERSDPTATTSLAPREARAARRLLRAIAELRRLDPDMQMPMAATFLLVAMHDGLSRTDVMRALGVAGSTATRNLAALTAEGRLGQKGYGLIEQRVNPKEKRWRMHSLTPKGQEVLARVLAAISDPED